MKRWWVMVRDVDGRVRDERPFFTRRAAARYGREVSSPPLTTYVVISDRLHQWVAL